jgi:hypothetical protein
MNQLGRRAERGDGVIGTVRQAALSPVEIGRLTDQIMRTIDHRIVAYRERQGRV